MTAIRIPQISVRPMAALLAASTAGLFACPAGATNSQAFYCFIPDDSPPVQTFVVPQGISQLQVVVQGAHGGNPGTGAEGGFGGLSQATFAVSASGPLKPGQQLQVWVGCFGDDPQGFGFGGSKGRAPFPTAGDGGTGGGGSAILAGAVVSGTPLLVAGGGGGGGGSSGGSGGRGGNGDSTPEPGQDGSGGGGADGGCADCLAPGNINGLDGHNGSLAGGEGGGGGGGGGYTAGGGGDSGGYFGGGGGGGAGSSYAAPSAQYVTLTTSQLAQDGLVAFSWSETSFRDPDRDGIPNPHDRCRQSELGGSVVLGRCNSEAGNDLDVDGCTITDRIVKIAKQTDGRREFLERVRKLGNELYKTEFITRLERRAIMQCAHKVNVAALRR